VICVILYLQPQCHLYTLHCYLKRALKKGKRIFSSKPIPELQESSVTSGKRRPVLNLYIAEDQKAGLVVVNETESHSSSKNKARHKTNSKP